MTLTADHPPHTRPLPSTCWRRAMDECAHTRSHDLGASVMDPSPVDRERVRLSRRLRGAKPDCRHGRQSPTARIGVTAQLNGPAENAAARIEDWTIDTPLRLTGPAS
jgi:hypothetical protein